MEITILVETLINLIVLSIGATACILFLVQKYEQHSRLLGMFLFFFSVGVVHDIIEVETPSFYVSKALFFPLSVSILSPLIYLSYLSIGRKPPTQKVFLVLSPTIFEFIFLSILFFLPQLKKEFLYESVAFIGGIHTLYLLVNSSYVYLLMKDAFKDGKTILKGWNRAYQYPEFLQYFSILFLVYFILNSPILEEWGGHFLFRSIGGFILILFLIYSMMCKLLREEEVKFFTKLSSPVSLTVIDLEHEIETAEIKMFRKINLYMRTERPHLNSEITLLSLSTNLQIKKRRLSELIRNCTGMNFNRFVNAYRVTEALEMLSDEKYDSFSVTGIGYEAGFNSKATFYAVFKDFTNVSPAEFRKQRGAKGK